MQSTSPYSATYVTPNDTNVPFIVVLQHSFVQPCHAKPDAIAALLIDLKCLLQNSKGLRSRTVSIFHWRLSFLAINRAMTF